MSLSESLSVERLCVCLKSMSALAGFHSQTRSAQVHRSFFVLFALHLKVCNFIHEELGLNNVIPLSIAGPGICVFVIIIPVSCNL